MTSLINRATPRRRYLSIARTAFQQSIAYRKSTVLSVLLTFIGVAVQYYLWKSAYAKIGTIGGFNWDQMRTYVVLAFGINALVGWRAGMSMMQTIRTGDVVYDFIRPLNYCWTQLARTIGFAVVEGVASLVIALIVGLVALRIELPASPAFAALCAISVIIGFVTKALIVFSVSLLSFWTMSGMGLMWSQAAIIQVFSGTVIPLALLPGPLRVAAEVLPLRGIVSTPVTIYLGQLSGWPLCGALALQLGWLVVVAVLANLAWRRAFNIVQIQGG